MRKRLINAADPDFRLLVQAALQTSARYSELARLTVADFNPNVGTVAIQQSKSGEPRHIVLTEEGVQFFRRLCAGHAGDEIVLRKKTGSRWDFAHQVRPMDETVDLLMQHLYTTHDLGDPSKVAFAAKVGTASARLNIFEDIKDELIALGIKVDIASEIVADMRKATNHAAQMLQTLRKAMGDVHGSKPALRHSAYDAIKWASAICALFEGRQVS